MQLYFADRRKLARSGPVPGIEPAELAALLGRWPIKDGTAVLLDDAMRPVEPVASWLEWLGARRKSTTSKAYSQAVFRLHDFLEGRDTDLLSACERDLLAYRRWRCEEDTEVIGDASWDKEAAGINSFYDWAVEHGHVPRRPWRTSGKRDSLRSGINRDMRVRHLTLEQYLYFRDVGFGGLLPDGSVDYAFRARFPQRSRTGLELALMTGMRLQEWSSVLLPEVGFGTVRPGEPVEFELGVCAKFGRPRPVRIPVSVRSAIGTFVQMEREEVVTAAQRSLAARRKELFVVGEVRGEAGKLSGVLDGRRVVRRINDMEPWLRRITIVDTGDRLEPMALFIGEGGLMLQPSSWDRLRWHAWERAAAYADADTPVLPRHRWVYHDLRHTFALRMLIFLTRKEMGALDGENVPLSTLLDHLVFNPILQVQDLLGHASPATTYRYVKYLRNPMKAVAEAFAAWSAVDGASYAEIAQQMQAKKVNKDATPW